MGKLLLFAGLISILCVQMVCLQGCVKEYSYEGGSTPIIMRPADSVKPEINFPTCDNCNTANNFGLSRWSFNCESSLLCGSTTGAVIAPDKNAFTFFGPSACSIDTGLVITVFLDREVLDRDKENITTNRVTLEFYDNKNLSNIFISTSFQITVTIDNYEHTTGIATGRFSGFARTKDGTSIEIKDGKFMIKFRQ